MKTRSRIRAGQLNQLISIRNPVRVEVEGGGYTDTPTEVGTAWAKVEPLQGNQQAAYMQAGMSAPHRFTIWYRNDIAITGATQIVWNSRTFDVTSVADTDARHVELVILCDEVKS